MVSSNSPCLSGYAMIKYAKLIGDGHPNRDMMALDLRVEAVQELFKEACLNYTRDGTVDGCFIDRAIDGLPKDGTNWTGMLEAHVSTQHQVHCS